MGSKERQGWASSARSGGSRQRIITTPRGCRSRDLPIRWSRCSRGNIPQAMADRGIRRWQPPGVAPGKSRGLQPVAAQECPAVPPVGLRSTIAIDSPANPPRRQRPRPLPANIRRAALLNPRINPIFSACLSAVVLFGRRSHRRVEYRYYRPRSGRWPGHHLNFVSRAVACDFARTSVWIPPTMPRVVVRRIGLLFRAVVEPTVGCRAPAGP